MEPEVNPDPLSDDSVARVTYLRDVQYVTTANFDARVALHAKYTTAPQGWFDWLVDQIEWERYRDVLEVGCGTGLLWSFVPSSVTHDQNITLIDLSPTMFDAAVARATAHGHDVRGFSADVHALPFDDGSFDMVIANHMLYHSPEPDVALREIARVLRQGGTLVAATNGPKHLAELHEIEVAVFGQSDERLDNAKVFGSLSGVPLLQRRFDQVEWRSHDDRLLCSDAADVMAYLTSMQPGSRASRSQLEDVNVEVQRRFAVGDGVLEITKDSGVFLARKA